VNVYSFSVDRTTLGGTQNRFTIATTGTVLSLLRCAAVLGIFLIRLVMTFPRFPMFPNPHIRSNAMLVRTVLLREFAQARRSPRSKMDAYRLESGRAGLTRFVAVRGLATLVCGSDGLGHPPSEWPAAGTFFTPGQPRLLIADNQTRGYADGVLRHRRRLESSAWGRYLTKDTRA
jgi:hypothetical protein